MPSHEFINQLGRARTPPGLSQQHVVDELKFSIKIAASQIRVARENCFTAKKLDAGVINPNERVYCPGHYRFGNNTWHCWKKRGHGSVNMHWALKGSCDVYFYEIARRMGHDQGENS